MKFKRTLGYTASFLGAFALLANASSFCAEKSHLTGRDILGNQPLLGGYGLMNYMDTEPEIPVYAEPGKQLAKLVFDDWRDSVSNEDARKIWFSGF